MIPNLNKSLLMAARPGTLREFYERVLNKPLPPISERGKLYEKYGLGPADDYIGAAMQNQMLLGEIYKAEM